MILNKKNSSIWYTIDIEKIISSYRSVTSPIKKKATDDYYLIIIVPIPTRTGRPKKKSIK